MCVKTELITCDTYPSQFAVINSMGVNQVTHTLISAEDSDVNTKECV